MAVVAARAIEVAAAAVTAMVKLNTVAIATRKPGV
jgi:hypothetical protein